MFERDAAGAGREQRRTRRRAVLLCAATGTLGAAVAVLAYACAGQDVSCGNGVVDPGEECDDGNRNNNDHCTVLCRLSVCGDGLLNRTTEECDDGNIHVGDGCDPTCHREGASCGNGVLENIGLWPEECDDGNTANGDGCSSTCYNEIGSCGDGIQQYNEECDDGNRTPCDGCDSNCRIEAAGTCDADAHVDGGEDDGSEADAHDGEARDGEYVEGADGEYVEGVDGEFVEGDGEYVEGADGETVEASDGEAGEDGDAADGHDASGCVNPMCDLAPQCGCDSGSKCTLVGSDRGCTSSGFLSEGRSCTSDTECSVGLYCAPAIGTDVLLCHRFCATDADCPGTGSRCLVPVTGGSPAHELARLCTVPCEVASGSGCPEGVRCEIYDDGAGGWVTDCSGEAGTGRLGHACTGPTDCASGYFCDAPAYPTCLQYCVAPDGYCDGGYTCHAFSPAVTVGTTRYGYCG